MIEEEKISSHPMVSVLMLAYNHEHFIEDAIKGVLLQKTRYSIELVIGEDMSTDETRRICLKYQKDYPDIIKVLEHKVNLGMMGNLIETYKACKGKYIAFCEGDDFWTAEDKIQSQVDFLENNKDYSAVCHNANKFYENWNSPYKIEVARRNNEEIEKLNGINGTFNEGRSAGDVELNEVIRKWPIQTGTLLFKNLPIENFPDYFSNTKHGDLMLFVTLLRYGKIYYENVVKSCYRIHENGATNFFKGVEYFKNKTSTLIALNEYLNYEHNRIFKPLISSLYIQVAIYSNHKKERIISLKNAIIFQPRVVFTKLRILTSVVLRTMLN